MSSASDNPHDTVRLDEDESATPPPTSTAPTAAQEDHAHITPINDAARCAFHEIASLMQSDPRWNSHARRFIHVNETGANAQTLEPDSSDEGFVYSDAESSTLTGYYRLNLAVLPMKFSNGWLLGTGLSKPTDAEVDILLSINGRRDNVRARHARIVYHQDSHAPMVKALPKKAIVWNGLEIKEQGRVLSQSQGIVVGNLAYRLEFLPINKASSFDPTPSNSHFELRGYQFQTPQAAGVYGIVSACLQVSTGDLYAVKKVRRTMKSFGLVNMEVTIMKQFGKHPHVCELVDTLYSDGDGSTMGSSSVNEVYMILSPWAPRSMADFIVTQPTTEQLTLAYHQGAQGIRHLHRSDIIHRDIKLANILVSTLDPLCVVVADFGHAASVRDTEASDKQRKNDLQNHMKGTISYLPPEIIALKHGTDVSGYWSKASDVFTYGVVGVELFHGNFPRSRTEQCINPSVYNHVFAKLSTESAMDELLANMIQWKASDRPTMDQVLLKSLWPFYETSSSTIKRKII